MTRSNGLARINSEETEYDAPTKVGPMSAVAVAKLMHEADRKAPEPVPPSGVRRSLRGANDDSAPPVLDHDDESFEPTVVDDVVARSGFDAGEGIAAPRFPSVVDAIIDEMLSLDDADLEVVSQSNPPPLPPRASRPAPRWQPRPAAFPEWIASAAAQPMVSYDRKRAVLIAGAGACATSIALLVWWLC